MNSNLVILPTRSRPESAERCINALKEHSVMSDFCIAIDDDQADLYPRLDGVIYEVNPRLRMNGTLNLVANKYADKYETLFFVRDEVRGIASRGDTDAVPVKHRGFVMSGALLLALENPGARFDFHAESYPYPQQVSKVNSL